MFCNNTLILIRILLGRRLVLVQRVMSIERERIPEWRRWVDLTHRVPDASERLFCFPWAGGSSLAFDGWSTRLPGVEVVSIHLPGRHV